MTQTDLLIVTNNSFHYTAVTPEIFLPQFTSLI